jgi:hypothetical protein
MKLTRAEFIAQFAIPFHVHCLKLWSRRSKEPPYLVLKCCFDWIAKTNSTVSVKANEFSLLAHPVIDELYRATPKGKRPDANDLAAKIYDVLNAAGVVVTINDSYRGPSN